MRRIEWFRHSVHSHLITQATKGYATSQSRTQVEQAVVPQSRKRVLLDELKLCSTTGNLKRGKQIHAEALESGYDCNYLASALIHMYAKCGSMLSARQVFDGISHPDVVSWNALILGYANNGEGTAAFDVFGKMRSTGCVPSPITYIAALKACISLAQNQGRRAECLHLGKEIHSEIKCHLNSYLQNTLITMYAKCGSMADAHQVFDSMRCPDVVSWNALILGYAFNGEGFSGLDVFSRMKTHGCAPNCVTYIAALKACISLALDGNTCGCLRHGKEIHAQIGCHSDAYVQNTLIEMYAKCGRMAEARQAFDNMKQPNVVSWNSLILGYAENGEGITALEVFARMSSPPDSITFVAALKACTSLTLEGDTSRNAVCRERGRQIHSQVGCHMNAYVQNTLIDLYAKCGSMREAQQVFDSMEHPDVVSWTALILGYAENGDGFTALEVFGRMKSQQCLTSSITYIAALKACTSFAVCNEHGRKECLKQGKQIHSEIGCHLNIHVQNTLIDMYAKCGSLADARLVFDSIKQPDVVSWTALISGYAENGEGATALDVFGRMRFQGCVPNSITYIAALKACSSIAQDQSGQAEGAERGKEIHALIGRHTDAYVQSSLIDMYAKCGFMAEAQQVFEEMQQPDVVSWTALILGYAVNGDSAKALDLFAEMRSRGCRPNSVAFSAALKACSLLGALESGRKIHAEIETGATYDTMLVNNLVDFYGKFGCLVEAQKVFDSHPRSRDLVTWNSLLAGYSRLGNTTVLNLFERMQQDAPGFRPDRITCLSVLTCCSHAGLVETATNLFEAMTSKYGVHPDAEHYNCMVDLLGRSNKLDDAMALLQRMPFSPNAVTWMTVLGSCLKWKNAGIGRLAFKSLASFDGVDSGVLYVLMAQLYETNPT